MGALPKRIDAKSEKAAPSFTAMPKNWPALFRHGLSATQIGIILAIQDETYSKPRKAATPGPESARIPNGTFREKLRISERTFQEGVGELVTRGFITREPDAADKRFWLYRVTPENWDKPRPRKLKPVAAAAEPASDETTKPAATIVVLPGKSGTITLRQAVQSVRFTNDSPGAIMVRETPGALELIAQPDASPPFIKQSTSEKTPRETAGIIRTNPTQVFDSKDPYFLQLQELAAAYWGKPIDTPHLLKVKAALGMSTWRVLYALTLKKLKPELSRCTRWVAGGGQHTPGILLELAKEARRG